MASKRKHKDPCALPTPIGNTVVCNQVNNVTKNIRNLHPCVHQVRKGARVIEATRRAVNSLPFPRDRLRRLQYNATTIPGQTSL